MAVNLEGSYTHSCCYSGAATTWLGFCFHLQWLRRSKLPTSLNLASPRLLAGIICSHVVIPTGCHTYLVWCLCWRDDAQGWGVKSIASNSGKGYNFFSYFNKISYDGVVCCSEQAMLWKERPVWRGLQWLDLWFWGLGGSLQKVQAVRFWLCLGTASPANTARNWAGEKVVPWRNASLFLRTGIMG